MKKLAKQHKIRNLALIALALLVGVTFLFGCPLRAKKPHIILVIIDTLRADHVTSYGYERPTTPHFEDLAHQAILFENTQAPASWTVPSMNSLFTGVYPWSHGVVYAETQAGSVQTQQKLSDRFVTLAETLQARGYETYGISANYHMHEQYGAAQGFDFYKTFSFSDREPVDRQFRFWLPQIERAVKRKKPYFLYIHYFDPHHPYKKVGAFTDRINRDIDLEEARKYAIEGFAELAQQRFFFENPDKMQLLVDLYDGEIAATDDSLGRLLKELPEFENAVIVVTSDHGEAFGEHENMIHGRDLYVETVRVPLIIRLPHDQHAELRIKDHVSLVDLYPTLAALAGAKIPEYLEGYDLAPLWSGKSLPERNLFTMTRRVVELTWYGIIGPRYKLVFLDSRNQYELYDMLEDPTEQRNIFQQNPDIAAKLRKLLAEARRETPLYNPDITGAAMTDELRETLKALGYL
ncbi:MAG: sulfatase [Alphaproteobacteria bacterium]